jgi:hypothetical protein
LYMYIQVFASIGFDILGCDAPCWRTDIKKNKDASLPVTCLADEEVIVYRADDINICTGRETEKLRCEREI